MPKSTQSEVEVNEVPQTQSEVNALTMPELPTAEVDESIQERRQADRAQKLKAVRFLSMPTAKSTELAKSGATFDIVDAVKTRINDEESISFILRLHSDGSKLRVNKSKNIFTETYLDYFESFAEGEEIEPMLNYRFVELTTGGRAGNFPVTFQALS